jgi:hypothetical protein
MISRMRDLPRRMPMVTSPFSSAKIQVQETNSCFGSMICTSGLVNAYRRLLTIELWMLLAR